MARRRSNFATDALERHFGASGREPQFRFLYLVEAAAEGQRRHNPRCPLMPGHEICEGFEIDKW